ncbi:EscU/YscU/HrcU family type III secretion system export apparatus switch protein [Ectothiorhodospira lacustris]|uniref:EscU/YscU/HrcU family type III secretion system export apparatus switch protein n=1 Tax=Ectothiorhodospira lacustris TaxID=2899127 RepID=UPI001EE982A6|nr:EscU/YscU/HrcU family type III secretion system export apparatus switch protein [Ectothiorhodospira lacustris]MCG5499501.1 EscU/YscU/HrcU family type III secretion system export apparatus switch protein [Ectothiorhodospira lacustris]MCG5511079.1 EscU/YscU/HrcU family type III secretion system export apparatus switch protein [Ectothiorhodospira lacustris]MCG5522913.1 EscU/YscU/HrcU family type III secretion system export apparatus switch protein [Ectothiorhodospira lacustris]
MKKPIEHKPGRRQAVALHYSGTGAPRLTAKGEGELAERMLEIARAHDVPVHRDAALSMTLSRVPLGEEIPENLYIAVAEVLAFIYLLSGRTPADAGKGQDTE